MMRKFVNIITALFVTVLCALVMYADGPYEVAPAGLVFDSVNELASYIVGLDEETANSLNSYGDAMKYLYYNPLDGIWLPDGISLSEIKEIEVTARYVFIYTEHDGVNIAFYSFASAEDGQEFTEEYVDIATKNVYGTIVENYDTDVYYACSSYDSYYCFIQDDSYYLLVRPRSAYDETMLEYCNAAYHTFGEAYNLEAESGASKITLAWDEIVDDSTYTVYWKRSSSDEWKVACETSKKKVNITGLKSGVSYDFKIEATGIESEVVTITAE